MNDTSERIKKLYRNALNKDIRTVRSPEGELLWHQGWCNNYNAPSHIERRALASANVLNNSTPIIEEGELIVGKPCYRPLTLEEQCELEKLSNHMIANLQVQGMTSHMAIDYEKLLMKGVNGIKEEILTFRKQLNLVNPEDIEKDAFYSACIISLDSVLKYSEAYAVHAEKLAEDCHDKKRKAELLEIAEICRYVPEFPARNFREALQSVHFITMSLLVGVYQLGRPDRYLLDFYRRDMIKGDITKAYAQELIDCFCIMFNEYVRKGVSAGFMVGGSNSKGEDITNELSYMFIESIGHTRLVYPAIGVCYTRNTPKDLLVMCCELLGEGLSHPAIFNDELIIQGLLDLGLPQEEACLYIHSTCVEITPIASSGAWVAAPYINLIKPLLDILENTAVKDESNGEYKTSYIDSFEELKLLYFTKLGMILREEVIKQNRMQMERFNHGGNPIVSCFVNDCIERGKDIDRGGARYNWIMPSFVGLANVADSLMVMKKIVFEKNKVSISELWKIIKKNYEGYEELHSEILNRIPKYGNDCDESDELVNEITQWINCEIRKYRTFRNDRFIPGLFCWIMHERLGSETMATPDGRKKGFPLGDGSGPAQGRELKGPTSAIISSTKWSHKPFIGGIAVNMKFGKRMFRKDSIVKMVNIIETYMERGGFEIQLNVVDKEILLKAQASPEAYKDLVVRIGGYSDYFTNLSNKMQEEVIARTEYEI